MFKIEDSIPIPEDTVEEPSRWSPYKPNQSKCEADKHYPMIGKCTKCGDIFPCPSGNCGHFDCADPSLIGLDCPGNGTETPEFFDVIESESPMARAECGAIEMSEEGSGEEEEELLD